MAQLTQEELREILEGNEVLIEKHSLEVLGREPRFSRGDVVFRDLGPLTIEGEQFKVLDVRHNGYKVRALSSEWDEETNSQVIHTEQVEKVWEILIEDITPENLFGAPIKRPREATRWVYERDYKLAEKIK
ncbi:MAG: hypothetical protein R3251_01945 [Candidatus Spechtbacterales bacterium]|nr:hypothetical protein [Candidatus Spechtbacterales bacterium]